MEAVANKIILKETRLISHARPFTISPVLLTFFIRLLPFFKRCIYSLRVIAALNKSLALSRFLVS